MNESITNVNVRLRVAEIDDAEVLATLAARLFVQTFGAANSADDMAAFLDATYSPARQAAELADPSRRTWLAITNEGEAVGFAMLRRGSRSDGITGERPVEIQRIYVDRGAHGRGVGRALMQACVDSAQEWNADELWLAVWEHNPRAIAFYLKEGFQRVGAQTFQLGSDRQRDQVMARKLSLPE